MASIYVYDNNSSDDTIEQARAAGACVRTETRQGKGNVVCRMFADIDADVYVMADGDGTYDSSQAPQLVDKLLAGPYDMVNGRRMETAKKNYRPGHRFGNAVLTGLVGTLFKRQFSDMLSGYKLFSRRYVKSFPAQSRGFEIETELTVHALQMGMAVAEVDTLYSDRVAGTTSKLNTWRDGFRILMTIIRLMKNERPFEFFGLIAAALVLLAALLFSPILADYLHTGLVPRFPTLILITGMGICAALSLLSGVLLEAVTLSRQEVRRLRYLSIPVFEVDQGCTTEQR
jgi:glycosyltransferase involved in cell wall biosynthesis